MPLTVACAWHVQMSLSSEHPAPSRSDTMEGDLHTALFTHLFGTDGQTEVGLLINQNNNSIQVHTPICTNFKQGCCCLHAHVLRNFITEAISLALNKASIMQNCSSYLSGWEVGARGMCHMTCIHTHVIKHVSPAAISAIDSQPCAQDQSPTPSASLPSAHV